MADAQDMLIQKKLKLLKTGLYGFIGCLVLCFFSLMLQVVISLWQLILQVEDTGSWLAYLGMAFFPVFFAGAFVCFGIIIASAVKEPRSVDMGERMKPLAGSIASFFITGVLLNVVPLLGTLAAFFVVLYYKGESVIFLALCYFVISMAVFFAAVGYAIVRSVGGAAGPGTDTPVMKRIFGALRPGTLSDRSRRVLSRVERVLEAPWASSCTCCLRHGTCMKPYEARRGTDRTRPGSISWPRPTRSWRFFHCSFSSSRPCSLSRR